MDQQNVPTMLMNRVFNTYGTLLCVCDVTLILISFALIIVSAANDANSEIPYDFNLHFHFGLYFHTHFLRK
jgi:hypothetical protein